MKNPTCQKCHGSGWYCYTPKGTPHSQPCELCCEHEGEPWQSSEDGKFYCLSGCGQEISVCCKECQYEEGHSINCSQYVYKDFNE